MEPESERKKTGGSKEKPVPSGGVAVAPTSSSPPPEEKLGGIAVQESVRVEGLMKAGSNRASRVKEARSPPVEKTSGAQPQPGIARILRSSSKPSKTGSGRKVSPIKKKVTHAVGKQRTSIFDVEGGVDPVFVLPEEIWEIILNFVKDPNDARSCNKTCKLFQKLLRPTITTWGFDQVFPFIQRYLNRNEVLNCRPVCQTWNGGVDAHLENQICIRPFNERSYNPKAPAAPSSFKAMGQRAYRFSNVRADLRYKDFLGRMRNHFRNPFIGRSVQICVCPLFWRGLYDFLQAFGVHIHHLQLDLNREEYDRVKAAQFLSTDVFRLCPELRSLRLKGQRSSYPKEVESSIYSASNASKLEVLDIATEGRWEDSYPLPAYAEALMRKYCHQLKSLRLQWIAWTSQVRFAFDWTNLTELHLVRVTRVREIDISALANARLPNLQKLGVKMLQGFAFSLDFASVMKFVLGLSSTSKLHVLLLHCLFDEDGLASAPDTLFAPESLTSLEVEHRSHMKVVYNYLLRFPFLENLHLFWDSRAAYDRACQEWVNRRHPSACEGDDVVELRRFMFGGGDGGSMYQSNVWRILPRLKVLSVQQQVYTRQGYDLYRKWEEEQLD